jgi:MFS family permease
MSLSSGLGNAAYAVGTVLAVQLAQHLPQRRMLLVYSVALVVGSVLAAAAPNAGTYICGHSASSDITLNGSHPKPFHHKMSRGDEARCGR